MKVTLGTPVARPQMIPNMTDTCSALPLFITIEIDKKYNDTKRSPTVILHDAQSLLKLILQWLVLRAIQGLRRRDSILKQKEEEHFQGISGVTEIMKPCIMLLTLNQEDSFLLIFGNLNANVIFSIQYVL